MHDGPSIQELLTAVKGFLDSEAMAELNGHGRFNARVASNVLATALREFEQRPAAEADEIARLQALLGMRGETGDLDTLNQSLIAKIRSGELDETSVELLAHLKATAIAQLNIDQPQYSGLKS
jgi:Arc/MetJ-type ribon-helix-helix transcriptional regulator